MPDSESDDYLELFLHNCHTAQEALANVELLSADEVAVAAGLLVNTALNGGTILICGNGGSAADSQHMAAELVSSFAKGVERRAIAAVALTTDSSVITAYSNDFDYQGVFARQVQALGHPGCALVAISTSGNSANVVGAAWEARRKGMVVVALTGPGPNALGEVADVAVQVRSSDTQAIQVAHLVVEHSWCHAIDKAVYESEQESPE
jgi:D-sedoheptulose 7-phosphate isomerase